MIKHILIATAAVALGGCESMYRMMGVGSPPPDPKNPRVWVITKANCQSPYILVSPEPVYIYRPGNAQTVPINWHLETDGYSFDQKTKIDNPTPVGNSMKDEIYDCATGGAKNMHCTDKAQNSGSWKYTLRVVSDDSKCPSPPPLDPQVSND